MQDDDQLSGEERELERALRMLRPAAASVSTAAAALEAGRRRATKRLQVWVAAAAAAAILIGGSWLAFGPRGQTPEIVKQRAPNAAPRLVLVGGASVDPPTALVYRRALGESMAALDDLLDRQGASGAATGGRAMPVVTVTSFSSDPFARSM